MRDSQAVSLKASLKSIPGVGEKTIQSFAKLFIVTVEDLLYHLPLRVEDFTMTTPISDLGANKVAVISGRVEKISSRKTKKGMLLIEAKITDQTGKISAVWFNQRFILSMIRPGDSIFVVGEKKAIKSLGYPFFVKKMIPKLERYAIYPTTKGLKQYQFNNIIARILPLLPEIPNSLPGPLCDYLGLQDKKGLFYQAHHDKDGASLEKLKKYLSTEELLAFAWAIRIIKEQESHQSVAAWSIPTDTLTKFISQLPYSITPEQRKAAWEIMLDLQATQPMNRLLYGEVGSGKTLVAALVALVGLANNRSVAFLTPTVALAHQQVTVLKQLFKSTNYPVLLHTAHKKEAIRPNSLVVGTHSLLYSAEKLSDLGIIVIDEQHRFGVAQRQMLIKKYPSIHSLMMTATPIPRSLTQTILQYLTVTYLSSKPMDTIPTITSIFTETDRERVYQDVAARLARNEPGYIICPLIEEDGKDSEDLFTTKKSSIRQEQARLKTTFPTARIETLHGKISSAEKQRIIDAFLKGNIDILLSTTVVEVGIDNQAATWIVIENADHFGLAQLHQLRGRVGRGTKASICYLHNSQTTENGDARLDFLLKTNNGITLAEYDLTLRGPGDIIGESQSGLPKFRFADITDREHVNTVFQYARGMSHDELERYPDLKEKAYTLLKDADEVIRG